MDEMKLRLSTKFMRNIVAKLISKAIRKKTGYDIDILINDLDIRVIDGETKIAADVELNADSKEFMKFIKPSIPMSIRYCLWCWANICLAWGNAKSGIRPCHTS